MNGTHGHKLSPKEKLLHELRRLAVYFVYLAVFFSVFRLYTRLILSEYHINYFAYGLTILKSLVLAKIILTGEALHLGERLRQRPLIIVTVYCSLIFSAFAIVFEVLEHLILGGFRGESPQEVLARIAEKSWPHLVAMALLVFVAFLPFFAFRETARVLGEGKLRDLFLKPQNKRKDVALASNSGFE
jgi:hypothetical protein